jgi:hypothetical protein
LGDNNSEAMKIRNDNMMQVEPSNKLIISFFQKVKTDKILDLLPENLSEAKDVDLRKSDAETNNVTPKKVYSEEEIKKIQKEKQIFKKDSRYDKELLRLNDD